MTVKALVISLICLRIVDYLMISEFLPRPSDMIDDISLDALIFGHFWILRFITLFECYLTLGWSNIDHGYFYCDMNFVDPQVYFRPDRRIELCWIER